MRRRGPALLVIAAIALAACSDDANDAAGPPAPMTGAPTQTVTTTATTTTPAVEPAGTNPPPTVLGTLSPATPPPLRSIVAGTEQLTVVSRTAGQELELVTADGSVVGRGTTDASGALIFRGVDPGEVAVRLGTEQISDFVTVMARDEHPPAAFYTEQRVATNGSTGELSYIETRDGTTLSASVWLPGPVDDGPYPTVVEYSGYAPSDPDSQGFPQMLNALGFAYVGVNMRGTGCSGGSFRYFEYVQSLDGYDAVEVVAAQPWVQGNRVGMVGVSYPGISQLFVAQTRPPSLSAITPLSVIADSYRSTLYPGGILNTGFAVEWTRQRVDDARPAGQEWAADRIDAGDAECAANQLLRLQNPDLTAEIDANPFWTDAVGSEIAPRLFVDRIEVPVFLAGAWQDEQTGGHFATMLDRFTGTEHFYATLVNGLHTESIGPAVFPRFVEFLDLYVAERVPSLAAARSVAPILADGIFGTTDVALPADDRFAGMTYAEALVAFEAEPPIEVLFEEGAADGYPARAPMARFVAAFDAWPVPDAEATRWYLSGSGDPDRPGELLADDVDRSGATGTDYLALPDATPPTFYEGDGNGVWAVDVDYDWQPGGPGTYAAFVTEPLDGHTAIVGSGSVDLWIEVAGVGGGPWADTDLEATISEVTPGGDEVYVQSGWLRASQRALDAAASTELLPVHTHLEADAAELPAGQPALVRVELFPVAHVFRAGSRIRLAIDAPGGNRAIWEFATVAAGERVTIVHDEDHPSSVVLPVVDLAAVGVDVPDQLPACGALRGQPCRPYVP
jgi:predicted acyl esterase